MSLVSSSISTRAFLSVPSERGIELRDYQVDAIKAVHDSIGEGVKRPAVVLATGGGKTVVFSHLVSQLKPLSKDRGNKTLVLAHREELVVQAAHTLSRVNPGLKIGIDLRHMKPSSDCDIVVASVATLTRLTRLSKYNPKDFLTIIVDECHHVPAASWRKILDYFNATSTDLEIFLIGFTATLERNDGKSLADIFEKVVYERSLADMIKNKELADIVFSTIDVNTDLAGVRTRNDDFDVTALSRAVNTAETNALICLSYLKLKSKYGLKTTLIFCVDIDHCKTLCGLLQEKGVNAQYITGETRKHERRRLIEDFKNGEIEVLCNVQVCTEGTDIPNIDSLILARPTKSRILLSQMIGRGLRLHRSKRRCHVIDLCGTIGTGFQSVPTLFSLPSDFDIREKSVDDLVKASEEQKQRSIEIIEKEMSRMKLQDESNRALFQMDNTSLRFSFKTLEGLVAFEKATSETTLDTKDINTLFIKSKLNWIRLEYDVWGYALENNRFFTIKAHSYGNAIKPDFVLTLNKFASRQMKYGSNFKCGKFGASEELMRDAKLSVVLAKAFSLAQTIVFRFKQRKQETKLTERQYEYLLKKMTIKARQSYKFTDEERKILENELSNFTLGRASDLIFAIHYSPNSIWVRWELNKILGCNKKHQSALKKKNL